MGFNMRDFSGKKQMLALPAVVILTALFFCVAASAQETRVDLKLNDGTVLIYKAKAAGFKEGQKLNVYHDNKAVGTLEIVKMMPAYAQAKIVTGADKIQELDVVVPEGVTPGAAAPAATTTAPAATPSAGKIQASAPASSSSAPAASAPASSGAAAAPASTSSSGRSKRGSSSTDTAAAPAASADTTASSGTTSKRSKRGSSSSTSSDSSASTDTAAAPSSGSSRRRGGSSSSTSSDSETSNDASSDASSGDASAAPAQASALDKKPAYMMHVGYFFLNQDLPGTGGNNKASLLYGIDIWVPKKNHKLVYSVTYTRPEVSYVYNNQHLRTQFRVMQLSVAYIFEDTKKVKIKTPANVYYGVSAGFRSANTQTHCEITCDGTVQFEKKSLEGFDYHGILGYRFQNKYEAKFDYSFDEKYYSMDVGFGF